MPQDHAQTEFVLLDTNSVRYLFDFPGRFSAEELTQLRTAVLGSVTTGRRLVVLSMSLISELSHQSGSDLYDRQIEFLLQACCGTLLLDSSERLEWELLRGRKLRPWEVFTRVDEAALADRALLKEEAERVEQSKNAWRENEERLRQEAMQELAALIQKERFGDLPPPTSWDPIREARRAAKRLLSRRQQDLQERCEESLADFAAEGKLPVAPHLWPWVRSIPTLWYPTAYFVYRLLHLLTNTSEEKDGERLVPLVDRGDRWDWLHWADSAYADVLVTEDGNFRTIVGQIDVTSPRVVSFTNWAKEVLKKG